jgi:hypothetical protein
MASNLVQRLVGLAFIAVGTGMTVWMWQLALTTGDYNDWAGAIFPAFAVLGLGMLLFPIDRRELQEKFGTDKIESLNQLSPVWIGIFVLALACGVADFILLRIFEKQDAPAPPVAAEVQPAPVEEEPHEPPPSGWRGNLLLLGGLLAIAGCIVAMVGMLWAKGAELLAFFNAKANPDRGMRVLLIGGLLLAAGIGLMFLVR